MPRRQLNDAELIEDSHHVLYEMQQLTGAVQQLASAAIDPEARLPDSVGNALLENVAMHGRALIEFAYPTGDSPRSDDVAAVDFLPSWPTIRPPIDDYLSEIKRRADKEIMHITRARSILPEDRTWQYGEIHNHLAPVLVLFIVEVPSTKVKPEFPREARAAFPLAVQMERDRKNAARNASPLNVGAPLIYGATKARPDVQTADGGPGATESS
jgi:hypothetical protein